MRIVDVGDKLKLSTDNPNDSPDDLKHIHILAGLQRMERPAIVVLPRKREDAGKARSHLLTINPPTAIVVAVNGVPGWSIILSK